MKQRLDYETNTGARAPLLRATRAEVGASQPWFPSLLSGGAIKHAVRGVKAAWWWIDRWRSSTAYTGMTLEEQGAYRNLCDELWLRGGVIPDDDRVLAFACGDPIAWPRIREKVLRWFRLEDDGWHHDTVDEVMRESRRRSDKQKAYRDRKKRKVAPVTEPVTKPVTGPVTADVTGSKPPFVTRSPSPSPSPSQDQEQEQEEQLVPPSPPTPRERVWSILDSNEIFAKAVKPEKRGALLEWIFEEAAPAFGLSEATAADYVAHAASWCTAAGPNGRKKNIKRFLHGWFGRQGKKGDRPALVSKANVIRERTEEGTYDEIF